MHVETYTCTGITYEYMQLIMHTWKRQVTAPYISTPNGGINSIYQENCCCIKRCPRHSDAPNRWMVAPWAGPRISAPRFSFGLNCGSSFATKSPIVKLESVLSKCVSVSSDTRSRQFVHTTNKRRICKMNTPRKLFRCKRLVQPNLPPVLSGKPYPRWTGCSSSSSSRCHMRTQVVSSPWTKSSAFRLLSSSNVNHRRSAYCWPFGARPDESKSTLEALGG